MLNKLTCKQANWKEMYSQSLFQKQIFQHVKFWKLYLQCGLVESSSRFFDTYSPANSEKLKLMSAFFDSCFSHRRINSALTGITKLAKIDSISILAQASQNIRKTKSRTNSLFLHAKLQNSHSAFYELSFNLEKSKRVSDSPIMFLARNTNFRALSWWKINFSTSLGPLDQISIIQYQIFAGRITNKPHKNTLNYLAKLLKILKTLLTWAQISK